MSGVPDLYDYDQLRLYERATMFVVEPLAPLLVLGSSQGLDVVEHARVATTTLRRRRGGGGLVLLRPADLWVDWWIPRGDERWHYDVHQSSLLAGRWWEEAMTGMVDGAVAVHEGSLQSDESYRDVCFAGRGPGEVFVDGRKAVGVSQWRVREGVFLSTVMLANPVADVVPYLANPPTELRDALEQMAFTPATDVVASALLLRLQELSAPVDVQRRHAP